MFGLLVLLFLVVPIAELYVIVQVASAIGVLETIGLLIVVSAVGAWLVKAQGMGVLARVQQQLARGQMPGKEMVDGFLILFAGALMLTPGFLTDALGLALLLPPTRILVRTVLIGRFGGRFVVVGPRWFSDRQPGPGGRGGDVYDVDGSPADGPDPDDDSPTALGSG